MQTRDYLKYIVDEIHSTVFAIVDEKGCPVTCAIDMMDCDESGLYFLSAKGKKFYERLKANENIAFTAMKGGGYPFLCGGVGAGQSAGNRAQNAAGSFWEKPVYEENIS